MEEPARETVTSSTEQLPVLSEVKLKWSEFMWSFEKLRHSPYSKKSRESDWFRINPLEMVLLGCQTLGSNDTARRDHGTLILCMENITMDMKLRPQYWQTTIQVLCTTLMDPDTPSLIAQRCAQGIMNCLVGARQLTYHYPVLLAWCIADLKLPSVAKSLLSQENKYNSSSLRVSLTQLLSDLQAVKEKSIIYWAHTSFPSTLSTNASVLDHLTSLFAPYLSDIKRAELHVPEREKKGLGDGNQAADIEETGSELLRLNLYLCHQGNHLDLRLNESFLDAVTDLVAVIGKCPAVFHRTCSSLVHILNLILQTGPMEDDPDKEIREAERQEEEEEEEDEKRRNLTSVEDELEGNGAKTEEKKPLERKTGKSLPVQFLTELSTALTCLEEKLGACCDTTVPSLFDTLLVNLSRFPLEQSLPNTIEFLRNCLPLLLGYCTEGYLSDSPIQFLLHLLMFVRTLAEHGISPDKAMQTSLPNLVGPFFGVRDHTVLCQLLQYGSLSVASQHHKALLTQGLQYMVEVWRLFPSAEQTHEQSLAKYRQAEALAVSSEILDNLLSAMPLGDKTGASQEVATCDKVETDVVVEFENIHRYKEDAYKLEEDAQEDTCILPPLTDEEKQHDRRTRIAVLLKLIELASEMVKNGENICFLYASTLPRLFSAPKSLPPISYNQSKLKKFFGENPPPPPGSLPWQVDTKPLALQLLTLSLLTLTHNMSTPFQLCAIVIPKLVRNIDRVQCNDQQKMNLLMDILKITQETLEAGHNIEELVTHGLDLLSNLLPSVITADQLRDLIKEIVHQLVATGNTAMLFLLKSAFRYMNDSFPDEFELVQGLFRALLHKGRKNEIRAVFRMCRDPFADPVFSCLRNHLFGFSVGSLNARQLLAICEIIMSAMNLQQARHTSHEQLTSLTAEEKEEQARKRKKEDEVLVKLVTPCLAEADQALKEGRFKREVWGKCQQQLARVSLFRTLFCDEFVTLSEYSAAQLGDVFESKFPAEVLSSDEMMQLLSMCATRIEHMQIPRYDSLRSMLADLLKWYLSTAVEKEEEETGDSSVQFLLSERERQFEEYILSLARNKQDCERLLECGYSKRLWNEHLSITVKTDGSHSLEENMRQTVLACYRELSEMLKQLAITHVLVDSETVKSSQLFHDELSLSELKGRRAAAVRTIDQRLGRTQEGHFYERKSAILAREDEIEAEFDKQASAPVSPKTFTASINTSFFDCAKCCGSQIVGCYAPTGEHCERPLEIGMRRDSCIISLYDVAGVEIENAEVLLCEEGAYIFKAYTNGHPYDTSQVWVEAFSMMLAGQNPLVPAVVVPKSFPNIKTWELMRRVVQPELTGSILTCRHDYSPEWRSYYDSCPERVRCGVDIVLHPGFSLAAHARPVLMRQQSKMTKDLAGLMFDDIMQNMLQDVWLKQFRFLGKVLSQYISVMVTEGKKDEMVLTNGFDYERWKKTYERQAKDGKAHCPPPTIANMISSTTTAPVKEVIVSHLASFVDTQVEEWCCHAGLISMCQTRQKQLLEMKHYLEVQEHANKALKLKLKELHRVLISNSFVVPISRLPAAVQEEIIHWVFNNEDRVWRYRGGRDGHETLQQFMNFLGGQSQHSTSTYPGVAVFFLPVDASQEVDISRDFNVSNMVGYAVGEMVDSTSIGEDENSERNVEQQHTPVLNCYEVVTAWVHPRYRRLNFSMHMYYDIACQAPARMVMCDMLTGSLQRIINSGIFPWLLWRLGITRYIIWKRKTSYLVTTQTGDREQFEQIVFITWPVRIGLWIYQSLSRVVNWWSRNTVVTPRRIAN